MWLFSDLRNRKAIIKSLAGLSINLSAAWFGLVLVIPNFWPIKRWEEVWRLIIDSFCGILFLIISFRLEKELL